MISGAKKFIVLFLVMLMAFLPFSAHAADYENEPQSPHVAVYNTELDIFVYEKDADARVTPAVCAKIMTALIALEYFEGRMQTITTVTSAALRNLEGSAVLNLKAGENIAVEHLIYAVLVAGMSDAANVLAIEIAGSISAFVQLMNEKATALGAFDTRFISANGLETATSYTTAKDTALIAAAAYKNQTFRTISTKRYYVVPATNIHESVTIYTRNMLVSPQSEYYDKNAIGICAGYSEGSGYAVVAAAESNFPYICVSLGSVKNEAGKIGGYLDVSSLLSWATSNFAELKILDRSKIIAEIPVSGGREDHVLIIPYSAVYAFLDADTDLSKITLSPTCKESLSAPVEKGTVVGEVLIILDGEPIASTMLVTKSAVKQSTFSKIWEAFPIFLILFAIMALLFAIGKIRHRQYRHKQDKNIK